MTTAVSQVAPARSAFETFPVGLFGAVMGLSGLSVAGRLAQQRYGGPDWLALVSPLLGWVAVAALVTVLAGYAVKLATAFDAVQAEFRHPIAGNLFGAPLISLLLLDPACAPQPRRRASVLEHRRRRGSSPSSDAWTCRALPALGLPPMPGQMAFALAVGLFFAVALFTLIFSRLLFEPPLPDALKPSLLILVAPFAVGCSTYAATVGRTDLFSDAMFMLTLFMLAVLLSQLRNLDVCCSLHLLTSCHGRQTLNPCAERPARRPDATSPASCKPRSGALEISCSRSATITVRSTSPTTSQSASCGPV